MSRITTLLTSKTVWGAIIGAAAYLIAQPHLGLHEIAAGIAPVLTAIGVRDAISQAVVSLAK